MESVAPHLSLFEGCCSPKPAIHWVGSSVERTQWPNPQTATLLIAFCQLMQGLNKR